VFGDRDLSTVDYVYVWADGIHVNIRLDEEKLCLLVMVGVRVDGTKELIALAEGYRESTGSWADLLRDCARRGMRAPILAVGDGALGFWSALREVFPTTGPSGAGSTRSATCCQRCRNRRTRAPTRPRRDLER
jgi:transposase-like protein